MVEQALLDGAIAKGYKQGINEEKENIIIIGHKEGISIESLARITRLSVPEVEVILKKAT
jgi:hypothetical protein